MKAREFTTYVYCKLPEKKRFYPLSGGSITHRLIYAEFWTITESTRKRFADFLRSIRRNNPDCQFKLKRITHSQKPFNSFHNSGKVLSR